MPPACSQGWHWQPASHSSAAHLNSDSRSRTPLTLCLPCRFLCSCSVTSDLLIVSGGLSGFPGGCCGPVLCTAIEKHEDPVQRFPARLESGLPCVLPQHNGPALFIHGLGSTKHFTRHSSHKRCRLRDEASVLAPSPTLPDSERLQLRVHMMDHRQEHAATVRSTTVLCLQQPH